MSEKHILTDADGVLLNWHDAFSAYMVELGYPVVPGEEGQYTISIKHNITTELAIKHIKDFNEGPYMKTLQPLADSVEYVTKLREKGYKFTVVTSLSNHPDSKKYRAYNLQSLFGNFYEELVCLEMGAIKTNELRRWKDTGYWWIEDHPKQAEAGHSVGLKPILIQHGYNVDYHNNDGFKTVALNNAWRDIHDIITGS